MGRVSRIGQAREIYPEQLRLRTGEVVRKLSKAEEAARGFLGSGRCYVYPNGERVLSTLVDQALETNSNKRELNEIAAELDPDQVSC